MPAETRWLAAGGLATALGLLATDPRPATVGYALALVITMIGSGAPLRPGAPGHAWSVFLAVAAGLAALAPALWSEPTLVLAAAVPLQAAAGLAAPSRLAALCGALLIGGAAVTVALLGEVPPGAWTLVLIAGVAMAGTSAQLLDALAAAQGRTSAPPKGAVGQTRIQLDRAQHDLAVVTSQLRRESKQRKHAEAQALAALKTRTAFLGVMSHELRTPLNQIIGYSELLLEEIADGAPDDAAADVQRIHLASLNLLEMISNVLDLSKIEAGTLAVTVEPVELPELIENLAQSFATQASQRGNVIRVRVPDDLPLLRSDRTKLRTVLANLLSNACKFTRDGTIRIAVSQLQHAGTPSLLIEVSDTGIGIPPEQIDRLFAAFVQADGSSTRRHDGSGLGLAIAHHFCALLGGEISVESTPGEGSNFRVRVPREFVDARRAGHVLTSMASLPPG
jgi:signal transduction histidine kinase